MSQQYSLRWNNHQPNFISVFASMLNTRTLVDVTLSADGKHIHAHKVVLSACSTYFQSLFVENPSDHPIVILKGVTYADLRTMVDFMYFGQVNVTEEQLPQVLETAKVLKIKGLTEMPESTCLTRSQGTSADFQSPGESVDSHRHSASPAPSPTNSARKRRRKSSTGSTSLHVVAEENLADEGGQSLDLGRGDAITLSSLPQQRRNKEYQDERTVETAQQTAEPHNLNVDPLSIETNPAGMPQDLSDTFSSHAGLRLRRSKYFKRQSRIQPEEREMRKQVSEPAGPTSNITPTLQKHESYPQYAASKSRRPRMPEQEVGSLLIRAVALLDRQASTTTTTSTSTSFETSISDSSHQQRASHTPAVRSGPPLSCNFCWNTVDECGRILRRKTQYHCPECRTNLCIVPCFHEYHDGPESSAVANAR